MQEKRLFFLLIQLVVSVSPNRIRLVSTLNNGEGRIEVYYNGEWGTVCDDKFTVNSAKVACKQLGRYEAGFQPTIISNVSGTGRIWLDEVTCTGTEKSLGDCPHGPWGLEDCTHQEDVGVICDELSSAARLVSSGNTSGEGRLELYYKGQWGTVCGTGMGSEEVAVICRMLGYSSGGSLIDVTPGSGYVLLKDVRCEGTEITINDCTHSYWRDNTCSHANDAGVRCNSVLNTQQGIRLVSSTQGAGRVEILHNNVWGTVCKKGFTAKEARVMCRMANLPWSGAHVDSSFDQGIGVIWLSNVSCQGHENRLDQCSHSSWGTSNCSHSHDVGVICTEARLSSGGSITRGRLEIFYNKQWGTVCDDGFTNVSAKVACGMVGQPNKHAYYERDSYGQGSGPVWLSNVQCSGGEASLGECSHSSWGNTSCSHSQDVGVVCSYPPEIHLDPNTDKINVYVGNDIVVECVVDDANPAVTSITWSHNGRLATGKTFRLQNASKLDNGALSCTASNGLGMTPGRAQTVINVVEGKNTKDNFSSGIPSKWTMIHTAAGVTGVVAFLIIVVLVVVVIHLSRKLGSPSAPGLSNRETEMTNRNVNPIYDPEITETAWDSNSPVYEDLNQETTTQQAESEYVYDHIVGEPVENSISDDTIYKTQ